MDRTSGTVASFDDAAGYGTVIDREGRAWFFHCTAIADRTRSIAEGTEVSFGIVAGRMGRWEADELTPVGGA